MKVQIHFLDAPYPDWTQLEYEGNVSKTYIEGKFFIVEFIDGTEISFPIDNIFSIKESNFDFLQEPATN